MATLYKRANPSQAMILRIVEGALKNACDAHNVPFDPYFARSVAKRAAGTLSSEMKAVLAAKPSEKLGLASQLVMAHRAALKAEVAKPREVLPGPRPQAGVSRTASRLAPLRSLEKHIVKQMRGIKERGETEKANAFIEILRKIAALREKEG